MKLSIVAFEAERGITIENETKSCVNQLLEFVSANSLSISNIISLNFFLLAADNGAYYEQKKRVEGSLPLELSSQIPIAYLAQGPATGAKVSVEVHYIPNLNGAGVTLKTVEGLNYLVIEKNSGEKLVIANGIHAGRSSNNILQDSEKVFDIMEKILHSEEMNFKDIFRQWNYIEGITAVDVEGTIENQHYQLFNNVRSRYYSKNEFKNGYPAATGIGTRSGGVIVSFYAATEVGLNVLSVENPLQKAAFEYTEEVLIGDSDYQGFCKSTPKFARAKFVENAASRQVYISGTASIREEKTIAENDVEKQTEITIDNIEKLISQETVTSINKNLRVTPKIDFFRVYIKNPGDFRQVKQTCENRWPHISNIYVVSDVCRENLLVEIEALASF